MKKTLAILLSLALLLGMVSISAAEEDWITLRVETYDREIAGLDVTDCWQLHYAQEHFGDPNKIKLEFVSFARWTEGDLLTTALAGGTAPDICLTYNGGLVQQCIDDEGIWQLDDLLNEYGSNLKAFLVTQTIKDLPPMQETRRLRLHPWAGKIPWRRAWQGT